MDSTILNFIKPNVKCSPDSLLFNILKIENTTTEKIEGELSFTLPDGWIIVYNNQKKISLLPGQQVFIPLRISIPKKAKGGEAKETDGAVCP